ncbi:hypothetical protein BJ546DRAFT_951333 [Cryomyces antarcticus]
MAQANSGSEKTKDVALLMWVIPTPHSSSPSTPSALTSRPDELAQTILYTTPLGPRHACRGYEGECMHHETRFVQGPLQRFEMDVQASRPVVSTREVLAPYYFIYLLRCSHAPWPCSKHEAESPHSDTAMSDIEETSSRADTRYFPSVRTRKRTWEIGTSLEKEAGPGSLRLARRSSKKPLRICLHYGPVVQVLTGPTPLGEASGSMTTSPSTASCLPPPIAPWKPEAQFAIPHSTTACNAIHAYFPVRGLDNVLVDVGNHAGDGRYFGEPDVTALVAVDFLKKMTPYGLLLVALFWRTGVGGVLSNLSRRWCF